ncbi:MAG: hypothetical protein HKN42_03115 [Granulosicoccus sp.]|nr:hypothetical protein [Granulosicoccus sp.]
MCKILSVRRCPDAAFHSRTVLTGMLWLLLSVSALAANPSPPGALRYKVYSSTAAEVFWNSATDDGRVVGYEVRINSNNLGIRDASSYFTNTLVSGQSYTVTVTSIDNQGNRSAPASVSFIGGDRSTPSTTGSGPAAPAGLRSRVYSSSSGELFWNQSSTFGLKHEISRNGRVVASIAGLSYYDKTLVKDTLYTYAVTAIDPQGRRSSAATVTLNTGTGVSVPPTSGNGPVAPAGLRSTVYSSTSAELFWNQSSTFGLRHEISRNGTVLANIAGLSYYDKSLVRGTLYTYSVTAIDPQGRRSIASSVMLNTPGGSTGGPVVSDGSALIREPANLYQGDGYSPVDVIRVDIRTVTTKGTCTVEDQSGCTLADVLADIDGNDELTVDIPIHFSSDDFADDGTLSNAELRLRGGGSRFAPQKSFRIKLDSKDVLWRNERYLQLNKHPFDSHRIRNKLAMDLMSRIPNLPSMRTQFVNLWIDDGAGAVDYGLFTHVERVNEHYLGKRQWKDTGNIYKAEDFRFDQGDLSDILVDSAGKPLNLARFETTLSIENGKDHRPLQAMLTALNNPARSFESVLNQYFDRDNALAWVAANILLKQADAVRHNYILYNPAGTEKFYFIPWDYDEAMGIWREPPNDLSNDSLRQRYEYGYGLAARNIFLEGFYRLPGIHARILQTVESLRQNIVTDELMAEMVTTNFNLVAPFQKRRPDSAHNPHFNTGSAANLISGPAQNTEALRTRFRIPIGANQQPPQNQGATWRFSWIPAYDVTGTSGGMSYRLQVARTPTFDSGAMVVDIGSIANAAGLVSRNVDSSRLSSGEYYARVITYPANEPDRFWQISGNKLSTNSNNYYGVMKFRVP